MTVILPPDPAGIAEAAALILSGQLVAFGTETVYGLGADATNGRAVAAIFEAKGRPRFNPLICHFASADDALAQVEPNPVACAVVEAFWPGPLTAVLPRRSNCTVDLLAGAGLHTLAVRVPDHPVALALLRAVGRPVAAPSANRSGGVSPTEAAHVIADLNGRIAAILDCGACRVGLESSVVDLCGNEAVLLRPGGVGIEKIRAVTGTARSAVSDAAALVAPRSPGLLSSHYAPSLPLRLRAVDARPHEALLSFGAAVATPNPSWNLSDAGDLVEAASRLFAGLRWLDAAASARGLRGIAVMEVPARGLGVAINDRLQRAAWR